MRTKEELIECPACLGLGEVFYESTAEDGGLEGFEEPCSVCGGKGQIVGIDTSEVDDYYQDDMN